MTILGFKVGNTITSIVREYGRIISFILLTIVGINMIRETVDNNVKSKDIGIDFKTMILLAIATSIDACAVGVSLSFCPINILFAAAMIGIITFLLSIIGVKVGIIFENRYEKIAQILGGIILVIIGIKSLFFV